MTGRTVGRVEVEIPVQTRLWSFLAPLGVGISRVRVGSSSTAWVLLLPGLELTLSCRRRARELKLGCGARLQERSR